MDWEKTSEKHKDGRHYLAYLGGGTYKVVDYCVGKWWAEDDYEISEPEYVCELIAPSAVKSKTIDAS